jgi:hypothetical protein
VLIRPEAQSSKEEVFAVEICMWCMEDRAFGVLDCVRDRKEVGQKERPSPTVILSGAFVATMGF